MTDASASQRSTEKTTRVRAAVRLPESFSSAERSRLYELMGQHFANVSPIAFAQDLDEKDWVVTLADGAGQLQGFSTLVRRVVDVDGQSIAMFYSGDTVIDDRYWGSMSWLGVWIRHVIEVAEQTPDLPAHWLLLTATHRTYRFLTGFYHEHWPRYERETPPEVARRIEAMVRTKFPTEYDAATGVVRLRDTVPVQPERAAMILPAVDERRATDRFVEFFCQRNPGYLQGDFLACTAPLSRGNLNAVGQRLLKAQRSEE
jgi:hypothetical protein